MKALVLVEHSQGQLSSMTAQVVAAALQLGGTVDVLVAGEDVAPIAAAAARLTGVSQVLLADDPRLAHQLSEPLAVLLKHCSAPYSHVLAAASTVGKNTLPRLAALRGVAQLSDVIAIIDHQTFKRPIYAGNAIATVRSSDDLKVLTIRTSAFESVADDGQAPVHAVAVGELVSGAGFVSQDLSVSERPELVAASVVVSGGRGMGNADNFALLERLADCLGGAVGASRAAVDAGYAANDLQVGQTGKIVAPALYMAFGISGAIQHLAGMKDSKVIVAVNQDPDAPIFQVADYGLVGDLFEIVPQLQQLLG